VEVDQYVDVPHARRAWIHERGTAVTFELLERGPDVLEPCFESHHPLTPALAYVAARVGDLNLARSVFGEILGMDELPGSSIHESLSDESSIVFRGGSTLLELSEASAPVAPGDALLSDQGLQMLAVGYRQKAGLDHAHERLTALGAACPVDPPAGSGGVYLTLPGGLVFEMMLVPREVESHYGFTPLPVLGMIPTGPGLLGN
jgi:catechol 2,3-dioxygenase-like lactoylglutathione lyase family enzyme